MSPNFLQEFTTADETQIMLALNKVESVTPHWNHHDTKCTVRMQSGDLHTLNHSYTEFVRLAKQAISVVRR